LRTHQHEKPWRPLTVDDVAALFADAVFPWWIAGGIALELAVGQHIRSHSDIDVLILRPHHLAARQLLADWDCWAADPPGTLRPWAVGSELADAVHDVWCREEPNGDWRLQLMLDETVGDVWLSRRDQAIQAPLRSLTRTTRDGIPYLAPHVQLYYKAKRPREKDELDFKAVIEAGISLDKRWLRDAIAHSYGTHHPWLRLLRERSKLADHGH
jgi:hypothetical protein